MKSVFLVLAGLTLHQVGSATPASCVTGTLASYEALGGTGCSIGTAVFASFNGLSGITGATPIDPTAVTVTPSGGVNPELTFSVNLTATAPTLLESIFNYSLTGPLFGMDTITLSGSSETIDGAVTDIQNYCAGGQFGPDGVDGCNGSTSGSLLTLDGVQNTDQTTLGGVAMLGITDDFTIDGGTGGTASAGTFADQYTSIPEPAAFLLIASGLVFAAFRKIRFFDWKF